MIPRGDATSSCFRLNLRRVCIAASAYTGSDSERPLFCSQWKSVMGRPQKRDPFVPHSVHMCTWEGGGGGCIFGSDSEVLTVKHSSRPGPFPSSGNLCVPTAAVRITQPTHAYLSLMKYEKTHERRSYLLAFLGNLQNKRKESVSEMNFCCILKKKPKKKTKRRLCLCEPSWESYSGNRDNPDQASLFFSCRLKPFPGQTSSASPIWTDAAVSVLATITAQLYHQSQIHNLSI